MEAEATVLRQAGPAEKDWFSCLSFELVNACLMKMGPKEVINMAMLCKSWSETCLDEALWRNLVQRDWSTAQLPLVELPEKAVSWRSLYMRLLQKHELKVVSWQRVKASVSSRRPSAREGHSFAPYGDGAVLFGGWGGMIRNDVIALETRNQSEATWTQARPREGATEIPPVRYGHSLTRCGLKGEFLVSFGGLISGGYRGPLSDTVVLRTRQPAAEDEAKEIPASTLEAPLIDGVELQFFSPDIKGQTPRARGYHAAAASEDGSKLYIFGGISHTRPTNQLAVLDIATWTWDIPATTGDGPCSRFGSAMAVRNGKLWIVGGGLGNDLLRSGDDVDDVFCLDLESWEWSEPEIQGESPMDTCIGREAGYTLVGSKLLLFGGSLAFHNRVWYLDLDTCRWGTPEIIGKKPAGRISGRMALVGDSVYMFGGWQPAGGECGDLFRLDLAVSKTEAMQMMEAPRGSTEVTAEDYEEEMRALIIKHNQIMRQVAHMFMMGEHEEGHALSMELEEISDRIMEIRDELREMGHGFDDSDSEEGSSAEESLDGDDGDDYVVTEDDMATDDSNLDDIDEDDDSDNDDSEGPAEVAIVSSVSADECDEEVKEGHDSGRQDDLPADEQGCTLRGSSSNAEICSHAIEDLDDDDSE